MSNNRELIPAPPDKGKVKNLRIIDNLKTGIAIINYQWVYVYVNKSYALHMKMNCKNLIGKTLFELEQETKTSYFFNNVCQHVMIKRTALEVETFYKLILSPLLLKKHSKVLAVYQVGG